MKRSWMIIALVAILSSSATSLFAQASTEGKEFWVALTMAVRPPDDGDGVAYPYIAISTTKPNTTIRIENPNTNFSIQYTSPNAYEWIEFGDNADGRIYAQPLPSNIWYPQNVGNPNAIVKHADEINQFGLKITTSEPVSVFAVIRANASMDAANILPITALQSDYCTQDYIPDQKDGDGEAVSMITILAVEDNTDIDIVPTTNSYGKKHPAKQKYSIKLKAGQTYYLMGEHKQSLSGTRITAKNGKKIAVFQGAAATRIPNGVGNRDCLYEQAMPTDYWGTEFVVTRSKGKDANFIKITTLVDNTDIWIDGSNKPIHIDEAYSDYEIELNRGIMKNTDKITHHANQIIDSDSAHYIESSCPIQIYKYDVGNSYTAKTNSEHIGGDPSSVWISPLQQKISKITFGTCHTDLTQQHYLDIVCKTSDAASIKIKSNQRPNIAADFVPVNGNKEWSFSRILLVNDAKNLNEHVFTIENKGGFVAQVYGHGKSESYAYSAGSSTIKRGVKVDEETYTEGYISETVYCIGTEISFDAQVGTDVIDKVDWDFGDGVSELGGTPQTKHTYDSPGWYDITANIYAHKECPYSQYPAEEVKFSFRVRRPDTIKTVVRGDCLAWDDTTTPTQEIDSVQPDDCATGNFEIQTIVHGRDTRDKLDTVITARDSVYIPEEKKWYYSHSFPQGKGIVEGTTERTNADGCTHTHAYKYDLTILTCLEMDVPNNPDQSYICPDSNEEMFSIPFHYVKGQISESHLLLGEEDLVLEPLIDTNDTVLQVATSSLKPGSYNARISVYDSVCDQTLTWDYNLLVYYPSNIFKLKFGNVFAVYLSAFNGGYEFTGYQWYKDGQPIEGATSSIYHTEEPFPAGATYYVLLTRKDGVVLPSCEQTIPEAADGSNVQKAPAAEKVLRNSRLYIRVEDAIYNIYGNRVE